MHCRKYNKKQSLQAVKTSVMFHTLPCLSDLAVSFPGLHLAKHQDLLNGALMSLASVVEGKEKTR